MSYFYWASVVFMAGTALGALLFFIAYWSGKRKARRK